MRLPRPTGRRLKVLQYDVARLMAAQNEISTSSGIYTCSNSKSPMVLTCVLSDPNSCNQDKGAFDRLP
jgi:hypothetical protein